jgi:ABC-type lipopolysaccharide export system ATPase subunit
MEVLLVLNSSHPFCILDEPFSGLSPLQIEKLVLALRVARQDKGIIITDHLHRDVRSISDELFVLSAGKTFRITDEEQLVELGYLVP